MLISPRSANTTFLFKRKLRPRSRKWIAQWQMRRHVRGPPPRLLRRESSPSEKPENLQNECRISRPPDVASCPPPRLLRQQCFPSENNRELSKQLPNLANAMRCAASGRVDMLPNSLHGAAVAWAHLLMGPTRVRFPVEALRKRVISAPGLVAHQMIPEEDGLPSRNAAIEIDFVCRRC